MATEAQIGQVAVDVAQQQAAASIEERIGQVAVDVAQQQASSAIETRIGQVVLEVALYEPPAGGSRTWLVWWA